MHFTVNCHFTSSVLSLLTPRCSLLSFSLTFSVAVTQLRPVQPVILLFAPELREKTGRLTGSGRWGETESCLNRAVWWMRAEQTHCCRWMITDLKHMHGSELWHHTGPHDDSYFFLFTIFSFYYLAHPAMQYFIFKISRTVWCCRIGYVCKMIRRQHGLGATDCCPKLPQTERKTNQSIKGEV